MNPSWTHQQQKLESLFSNKVTPTRCARERRHRTTGVEVEGEDSSLEGPLCAKADTHARIACAVVIVCASWARSGVFLTAARVAGDHAVRRMPRTRSQAGSRRVS
jgi:hypothetical protein